MVLATNRENALVIVLQQLEILLLNLAQQCDCLIFSINWFSSSNTVH